MASKIFKLLELKEKFLQSSDLLEADSLDRQSGFVALPSSNRIDFICIKSTKVDSSRLELDRLAITLPNSDICSLTWNKSFTGNESDGIRALLALSQKTGNVSIFKMMYSSTACSTELHRLTLKGLIREHNQSIDVSVNECEVLNFSSDLLTVLVDKLLIIQLRVHETKPWQIVYTIPCPHQVISATVTGAVIALLDSDHSTLLYDLKTSSFLAVIQRQKEKHWVSCRLTPNYLHMIYQNDTGQLFCCNLDLYFHQNPLLLIRDESPSPCSGDESQPTHWYHKLKFSDSQVSSEKKQYPNLQTFIKIPLSGDCLYYQCTSGYVSAYCLSKGSIKVSSYSVDSQHVEELPVDARQHVVLSNIDTIPHLLISDSFVSAAMIGHSHKFYTERDTKSGLLDTIALQNGWCKQTSSYNIQNLKRALEIRKVDYVLEHIRTKSSFMEDIMRSPPIDNRTELKQMVDMIHTAVSTYMAHSTTRVFAQQVTEAMVTFFKEQERRGIAILNDMLMANNTEKKGLMESLLEKLFDYKTSFTDLLQGSKSKKPGSDVTPTKVKSRDSPKRSARTSKKLLSLLNEDLVKKWNSLSSKELIEDGILMGDISKLQTYFTLNHREAEASWDVIVRTGLECVLDELAARNWSTVCQILKNLGFGVFTKLSQIAVYTTDTSLRRYLVKQLKMEGEFTESENQAIQFSTEFDELHPCQSFQLALEESRKCADFSASDTFMIRKLCGEVGVIPQLQSL
ncbi:SPG11 [Bugula neritina]|uniref:SPG11 n=1 Tax=Bugula neritina TaxID=10212 RepID=A0A7J7JJV4_BUGNE|nr:SPG11 [Bugula neritina]